MTIDASDQSKEEQILYSCFHDFIRRKTKSSLQVLNFNTSQRRNRTEDEGGIRDSGDVLSMIRLIYTEKTYVLHVTAALNVRKGHSDVHSSPGAAFFGGCVDGPPGSHSKSIAHNVAFVLSGIIVDSPPEGKLSPPARVVIGPRVRHMGVPGNERADVMAKLGAESNQPEFPHWTTRNQDNDQLRNCTELTLQLVTGRLDGTGGG
ncbi:hypothetical protein CDAR_279831 [Caerostris darwini]|uniref:RNase H type-1 domain-containing protein n=1 Tax=Caerostris darwini TaxID=1538125 RepID=A0AAV4V351_9ARAC|nr:hypothetical protein CDAR_279831 [Caerostris darwini]